MTFSFIIYVLSVLTLKYIEFQKTRCLEQE